MAVKNVSLLAAIALSGCAVFAPIEDMVTLDEQTQDTELSQNVDDGSTLASSVSFQNQFKQDELAAATESNESLLEQTRQNSTLSYKEHNINHYVRGLMQDLVANLQYVNSTTPVAVVSFVMLDSNYNDSNLLGIQIAESLIHEVHKFGIPVIDFKTTGYIRITEQGDFAFSKDYEDFSSKMAAHYIVGGTMLKHTDGHLINARIVGLQSQAVVASAQSFIPNSVSEPILMMSAAPNSSNRNANVKLGSEAFPLELDSRLSTRNNTMNQKNMGVTGSLDKVANISLLNSVSLIQE
jgi:TolB-like protein